MFYAEDIFHRAGTSISAYYCMVAFGIGQVLGSLVNMMLIDRLGRRFLVIGSSIFVIIPLYVMAAYFLWLKERGFGFVPLVAMSVYTVAFAIGLGPVAWVIMGEMLPLRCRGYGSVISTSVNWAGAFLITNQWYNMQHVLSTPGAYALLGTFSLALMVVFIVKLPETKGRTLAEIEGYFVRMRRVDVLRTASDASVEEEVA